MKTFGIFLAIAILGTAKGRPGESQERAPQTVDWEAMARRILPRPEEERWKSIGWLPLVEAFAKARRENKPVYVATAYGDPLGRC